MYAPVSDSGTFHDFFRRAVGNQFAAVPSSAGTEVDHVVGAVDGLFVVLDDQDGVAQVAQFFERVQQAVVVAMVQADGRLVEHVEHAAQLRSDLRGQANALALAAGERGRRAVERNVAQTDCVQKLQALDDLMHDAAGNQRFPSRELDFSGQLRARAKPAGR